MAEKMKQGFGSYDGRGRLRRAGWHALVGALAAATCLPAFAAPCDRTITANVVALDMPILNNRLGASNVNGMMFALREDVVDITTGSGASLSAGSVKLRDDKRPRPLVLRVAEGDCLTVNFQNLLKVQPNARNFDITRNGVGNDPNPVTADGFPQIPVSVDEQVADRRASFHVAGMQLRSGNGILNDGSYVGANASSLVAPGGKITYELYAEKEQVYQVVSYGAIVGSDANQGNVANGLFGQVIVEPKGARIYRNTVTEEEMRLATRTATDADPATCPVLGAAVPGSLTLKYCKTSGGQPVLDYEATFPNVDPWKAEGLGGRTVLNMIQNNVIVHTEVDAVVAGPNADGTWDKTGTNAPYPLERADKRNPAYPNRIEPFRDFAQVWHDEVANAQAYPGFYKVAGFLPPAGQTADPLTTVFAYLLKGVRDKFMINYASGGIGTEILSNRLGVGPMYDCLGCAYEEFFLTHFTVGEVGQLVDIPANAGLETITPQNVLNILLFLNGQLDALPDGKLTDAELEFVAALGPKATKPFYPGDPANLNHSYIGDFVKFRNTHNGFEQHVFHLHNHQWLFNPNDDNSNYLDAQGIGPGMGYTYEIANGGSGNRNRSAGDAIYHCHFYPHFAQGMWYMWRIHDVFESGTKLQASGADFHAAAFALKDGTPAAGARALPDGELTVGVPIPAVVPLPGKGLAPMPADGVTVVAVDRNGKAAAGGTSSQASLPYATIAGTDGIFGTADDVNPGYPFWIAGIACGANDLTCDQGIVGQRPTTPPLDMVTKTQAAQLVGDGTKDPSTGKLLTGVAPFNGYDAAMRDNFVNLAGDYSQMHGGLPRHALHGVAAGGVAGPTIAGVVSPVDLTKFVKKAKPAYFPEGGTEIERAAMVFHSLGDISTVALSPAVGGGVLSSTPTQTTFRVNKNRSVPGAVYADPCQDDAGNAVASNGTNQWNSNSYSSPFHEMASGPFGAYTPRVYKGANIQYDAVINKVGYHYPQQRIVSLWEDALPVIEKNKPGEPLVMRMNTFDCTMYHHTNLVPETYEMDDYQLRTPTDIIGQHIHLPKWDLSTTDGAANGWNYEDGTLAAGAIRERIEAIRKFNHCQPGQVDEPNVAEPMCPEPLQHPYFPATGPGGVDWRGARITLQRWFTDPVLNVQHVDRGLGVIFTHDHYGPSTFQQIGLYSTVLVQPANSTWKHSESGNQLGCATPGGVAAFAPTALGQPRRDQLAGGCRNDGGPVSWQAAIVTDRNKPDIDGDGKDDSYREFYFEYTDFQHAYEAGVYVGAGPEGAYNGDFDEKAYLGFSPALQDLFYPSAHSGPADGKYPAFDAVKKQSDTFRFAIAPPLIKPVFPIFPDLVLDKAVLFANGALSNAPGLPLAGAVPECIQRPCPTSIDFLEPGMFVVNYRNEPGALRIYDPYKPGPDALPGKDCSLLAADPDRTGCGAQAAGQAGDLAFVFSSEIVRAIPALNRMPVKGDIADPPAEALALVPANIAPTVFPPHINEADFEQKDPFTPLLRTYTGDRVRIKAQAGGDEEEHSVSVHGMKWLKAGSGFGRAPHSGWVNQSAGGISEQFAFASPVLQDFNQNRGLADYLYMMDAMQDGVWNGDWGIMRNYRNKRGNLYALPNNPRPLVPGNRADFKAGQLAVCPKNAPEVKFDITAVAANLALPAVTGVTIPRPGDAASTPVSGPNTGMLAAGTPDDQRGALPPRTVSQLHVGGPLTGNGTLVYNNRTTPVTGFAQHVTVNERGQLNDPTAMMYVLTSDLELDKQKRPTGKLKANVPHEPLVMRVNAGDCVQVTLRNRLPEVASDLPNYNTMRLANKRNRSQPEGSTYFGVNLVRPSSSVGFHTQLLEYDVTLSDGTNVGVNPERTLTPGQGTRTLVFYAGDLAMDEANRTTINAGQDSAPMIATAIEFGPTNILPADRVKQPQKGLFGQITVMPRGATAVTDTGTRAQATVTTVELAPGKHRDLNGVPGKTAGTNEQLPAETKQPDYRDFSLVWQKMMNYRYASGNAVQNESEEGPGTPENPPHTILNAANYRAEPTFFRFGIPPLAAAGNADCGLQFNAPKPVGIGDVTCFGSVLNAGSLFSNVLTANADPQTPIFKATPGQPFRIGLTHPNSSNRGTTFQLHGHVWPRDPFLSLLLDGNNFPQTAAIGNVGSVRIGDNPLRFYLGAQESIIGSAHFVIKPTTGAGGVDGVTGDYLFRDTAAAGMGGGAWGILRVQP